VEDLLAHIRCPRSHTPLRRDGGQLVSEAGHAYPLIEGKPVLVKRVAPMHVTPPARDVISQNIPVYPVPETIDRPDQLVLHLGSGNVPCPDPRVVSVDVLPCEHVDLVSEAEELPFRDDTFDYVESGAVFEHVYDPIKAAREARRVLKPGGLMRIDTAFLQAYHGYPSHYFNMTPQAVETFLADDFILEESMVPESATAGKALVDLLDRFLYYIPGGLRGEFLARPLADFLAELKANNSRSSPLLAGLDEFPMRAMAASFVVLARKPEDYEERLARRLRQDPIEVHAWQQLKRDYYARRLAVIQRHHEAGLYVRFCRELGIPNPGLPEPEALDVVLGRCMAPGLLDSREVDDAMARMQVEDAALAELRERWLAVFVRGTQPQEPPPHQPQPQPQEPQPTYRPHLRLAKRLGHSVRRFFADR
jgi:SAM-dependent methyltransferase